MKAVLHGTWITRPNGKADELFFVWAERPAMVHAGAHSSPRIRRHPCAATTIEIADLLATYVPSADWHACERLTRIVLLPSSGQGPLMPRWLIEDGQELEVGEGVKPILTPWRVEGLGVPILRMLDVLAALPLISHGDASHRLGVDLSYWGMAAKFTLELLARQRFLPGLNADGTSVRAVWLPALDDPHDETRLALLTHGMPPICRAVFRERGDVSLSEAPRAEIVLQSFIQHLIDSAVREWAACLAPSMGADLGVSARDGGDGNGRDLAHAWRQALCSPERDLRVPSAQQASLTRLYQAWQSWTYKPEPEADAAFRLCFRLEPPEWDGQQKQPNSQWTLRYFLQANDDPSLLVPAADVWRERGHVLSYLNHRFDQPQEKLLAGLGRAASLSPAVQRSLKAECPELAVLSAQEAFTFLRETARLLESMGFGVLVPPWWNTPDARLRVRVKLRSTAQESSPGILNMDALMAYDWQLALGDEPLTKEEFERLAELKMPLVQVRGRWVLLQPDQIEAAIAFWENQQAKGQLSVREGLNLALGGKSEIDGLAISEIELDDQLAELLSALNHGNQLDQLPTPQGFVGQLRPYQVRGFSWLTFLCRWGLGACLADDMGLGKTIQAIAWMLHHKENNGQGGPVLLICPTSVVGNWTREVARFAPHLRVMVHHGSGRAEGADFVAQSQEHDLVISTYGLARRDLDDLGQVFWSNVILDEAQNIKNPLTKQARAIRMLKGANRIALTGTPIENRLTELWSIMSFLNPGYLGSLDSFRRNYAIPIERYQDHDAAEQLRRLVRPFVLRRLKTDPQVIQDLPEKFEYKVLCHLTREQATLYEAVVRDTMTKLPEQAAQEQRMQRRGMVLAMLTRLKQVCDHPVLFLKDGSDTGGRSAKLNRLCEMLEEVLEVGDRALVFTQFAEMGALLQRHLQQVFGQPVLFLHGGTPQKQRDLMTQRFQDDRDAPAIFVLSLKAGGTGLNLMRANHVFHYDRWWNPAVENQATDRAYRIGQTRDVQVHKLMCLGTLEERIDLLIESKRALADQVVGAGEDWLSELSTDDLRDLVTLRTEALEVE